MDPTQKYWYSLIGRNELIWLLGTGYSLGLQLLRLIDTTCHNSGIYSISKGTARPSLILQTVDFSLKIGFSLSVL
jgi:hypothetical protein